MKRKPSNYWIRSDPSSASSYDDDDDDGGETQH